MKRRLGEIIIVIGVALVLIAACIDIATGAEYGTVNQPIEPTTGVHR